MRTTLDPILAAAVRLALVPEFSPRRLRRFVDAGGTLEEAAAADAATLARRLAIPREEAESLARRLLAADPSRELADAARAGVSLSAFRGPGYPEAFGPLADPPPAVYLRGALLPCDGLAIAVVGSRRPSAYGLRMARALAGDLARSGVTVVAGLARGIDAAAHEAALDAGGRTVAVLGNGLLEPYPPEHLDLIERIAAAGAVLSEFPMRAEPEPHRFPQRNRLIAALSIATIVVEAGERSGALSTARHALEQGREVMAVPGPVDAEGARGTLRLLQEGAAPVGSSTDVFGALGWCGRPPKDLPAEERGLLDLLACGPAGAAEAARGLGIPEEAAAGLLILLEIRGLATRGADGRYSAV